MKISPQAADAFAAAFAAKPNLVVSGSESPEDTVPRVKPARPAEGETVTIRYKNYKGEISVRTVDVLAVWFGGTKWHPDPQWLFTAVEPATGKTRDFAVEGVIEWDASVSEKPAKEPRFWIVWNPLHPTTPAQKYKKKVSAEIAAKRLCRKHPDQADNIYVLQPCSAWKMGSERPKARHF